MASDFWPGGAAAVDDEVDGGVDPQQQVVCARQAEEYGWRWVKPARRYIPKSEVRENGEPATLDPVLNDEELADDEDDSGHVADGEDAHHAGQHESQVRLVAPFFPRANVRVPENEIYSAFIHS